MPIPSIFKDIFWKLPFLSKQEKEKMYYSLKGIIRSEKIAIAHGERGELLENMLVRFYLILFFRMRPLRV